MRPSALGLLFIVLVSAAFTALTVFGVLGVIWLVLGPGAGAAAEIAASFYDGSGGTSSEPRWAEEKPGGGTPLPG